MATLRDPLAEALREALEEEERRLPGDEELLARAILRASSAVARAPSPEPASLEPALTEAASGARSSAPPAEAIRSASPPASGRPPVRAVLARSRARRLRFAVPLAAAFTASVAMAAVYWSRAPEPAQRVDAPNAPEPPPAAPSQARASVAQEVPAEDPTVSVDDLPSAKRLAAVTPEPARLPPSPPPDRPVTAAELFRQANAERRAGNIATSLELYQLLQKKHPGSSESQAARVSVGRLLLDQQGDAAGALAQFDAYLAGASHNATLAEEARLGRALALQRLGDAEQERKAWEELVGRHPQTLHSSRARKRIEALAATNAPTPR